MQTLSQPQQSVENWLSQKLRAKRLVAEVRVKNGTEEGVHFHCPFLLQLPSVSFLSISF